MQKRRDGGKDGNGGGGGGEGGKMGVDKQEGTSCRMVKQNAVRREEWVRGVAGAEGTSRFHQRK